ncbi:acyl-CoA dehydrogenase [Usitatibacter palustris]|uniref:Acyl-coenzyme A dehydrogenase n=1 Tax=Usitatibacter palustris TaxID=2732487 RepID=A0A6M4H5J9_9PROT|nr:acyl-CoA dehydrogenase [Usitatibacter palustris]QJR13923.1 Acyl-coenzyme A dehydrogenase [Usitatibacter palustris]
MVSVIVAALIVVGATKWFLAYHRGNGLAWTAWCAIVAAALTWGFEVPPVWAAAAWIFTAIFGVLSVIKPVRRMVVTGPIFGIFKKVLPQVSQTEQEALDAGSIWWDADLFTGKPEWKKMLDYPAPKLSTEEQAFLDGPVEKLCGMLDDWETTHNRMDLSPEVWKFIREQGFLGIIIPKSFGGLGFSAFAHTEIVTKISTRSGTAAVTVMVPNSLGPAELLIHYGTDEQKNHYLPRLAKGQDIPCFALTNPEAGSDAGAIPDFGIVCKGQHEGREVLGIRLTWEKRYITLAPVATILGLAFKLYDPDKLIGTQEELGITLALVPTNHKGVNIGRRHIPLDAAFMNGPTTGKDVFIPMDWVIGGQEQVGNGWRMLVECLAAGRSISLPSMSMAAGKLCSRATGAYARVRSQFKTPIGKFEGIEEALARIGGNTYMMDATRRMTMAALDMGEKPSVISAICKYHMTERMRSVITDAMDIHGGKGIMMGPNNYLGRAYQAVPVAITVEGANILTRSLIIFGQGAIRCHPYVLKEIKAAGANDLVAFDAALWGHISFTISNAARALWLGITGGKGVNVPGSPETRRYLQMMTRFSSAFALLADISMFVLGGTLKRKEKLSGRLGDILSMLYMASATVKRFHDEGRQKDDIALLTWSVNDAFFRIQVAMDGVLANFPNRSIAWLLRVLVFPKGLTLTQPYDKWGARVAQILITPGAARDRLTAGAYVPRKEDDVIGRLEFAMEAVVKAEPIEAKIRAATKEGKLAQRTASERRLAALNQALITQAEYEHLTYTDRLKRDVIKVDDFEHDLSRQSGEKTWSAPKAASM